MIDVVVEPCREEPQNLRYVVYADGTRAASAIVSELTADHVYVHTLGTDEPYRRRGYARAILEAIQRDYQAIDLDVFRLNAEARTLYEAVGFYDDASYDDDFIRRYRWVAKGE